MAYWFPENAAGSQFAARTDGFGSRRWHRFFTIPAAKLLGEQGHLIAIEVLAGYVKHIEKKLNKAGLNNVRVIQRDALETGLEKESVDTILLFGVIPFPTLP